MLFGDKQKFCIEVQEVERIGNDLVAQITLWISGDELGDKSRKVMLNVPVLQYEETLNDNRHEQNARSMDTNKVWEYFELNSFGEGDGSADKYNICVNYSESFDGEYLFLATYGHEERYLWKKFGTNDVKEIKLPLGTYQRAIEAFICWFRRQ